MFGDKRVESFDYTPMLFRPLHAGRSRAGHSWTCRSRRLCAFPLCAGCAAISCGYSEPEPRYAGAICGTLCRCRRLRNPQRSALCLETASVSPTIASPCAPRRKSCIAICRRQACGRYGGALPGVQLETRSGEGLLVEWVNELPKEALSAH